MKEEEEKEVAPTKEGKKKTPKKEEEKEEEVAPVKEGKKKTPKKDTPKKVNISSEILYFFSCSLNLLSQEEMCLRL